MAISLLIGSGFSVPYGLNTVTQINDRFTSLSVDDFSYSGGLTAMFLSSGQEDQNSHLYGIYKEFFVFLIKKYSERNSEAGKFHYESFYDFYFPSIRGETSEEIQAICAEFRELKNDETETYQYLNSFHSIFTQLLASMLQRGKLYENGLHLMNTKYDQFTRFISALVEQGETINIHTLNHDLLMEHLGKNTQLWQYFSDGFTDQGSPYYGYLNQEINKLKMKYKVRLARFTNKYSNKIRLFKLHGSVDMYQFGIGTPGYDETRVKNQYGVFEFFKEVINESGELEYQTAWQNAYPDFLSGTTEKTLQYNRPFYMTMFEHFSSNLRSDDHLIIIGYGFWDGEINNYIKDNYISRDKIPYVVDPYVSQSPFYQENQFHHIRASATDEIYSQIDL